MNIMTALMMFVCNDYYGCQTVSIPLPQTSLLQCNMHAPLYAADWAASLDGMARVHSIKCISIPIEPLVKENG